MRKQEIIKIKKMWKGAEADVSKENLQQNAGVERTVRRKNSSSDRRCPSNRKVNCGGGVCSKGISKLYFN